ncbi:MAG TPA: lysylphosphatidylglycerol synthase domain-containing protein [Longimicrobiales bacterium]|nr:lysylphosphatidylglycerol synthase domain-containing protein [Longimicrobiales bacterium]
MWRRGLVLVAKVVLTVAVTVFIARRVGVDLQELASLDLTRWSLRPLPLIASVVALALGYAWSASLWGRMVHELGGPRLPARTTVPLFLVANLGRYVPGKLLQIAGLTLLARGRGVPAGVAAGAAVLGQGVALLGATVVGVSAFLSPALPGSIRIWGWVGLGAVLAFVALTSVPGPAARLEALVFRLTAAARRFRSSGPGSSTPLGGMPPAPDPGESPALPRLSRSFGLRWTALYAMNWGLYATAFWLLFLGLEGFLPFLYVAPAFAAAYVGGYLALFAPAGLGVREGLLVALLLPVLEAEPALALAVVARLWTTVVEVIPAALMAPGVLRGPRHDSPPHASEAANGRS